MAKRIVFKYLIAVFLLLGSTLGFSQAKRFNIQYNFPSSLTICGKTDSLAFDIRNISATGVNNISVTLKLPTGCNYVASSFKGAGVSEQNISNLNAPVFTFSNFTLAGYLRFSIKMSADCNLQTYISKGNPASVQLDFTYTGGNENHVSNSINVAVPNILINTMTNQVVNAYINDKFVRETTLRNTGKGGITGFLFFRNIGSGLKVVSSRSKDRYNLDSIVSKLDSNDFKLVGNKDAYLDGNEEVKITDTVYVIKCVNLNSVYNVRFGCGTTLCNTSSKNAIVNLIAFVQGLKGIPASNIDWCFDASKPTKNSLIIVNRSNQKISNTYVNIMQSYVGGFYVYEMSSIDTASLVITLGKRGKRLPKLYHNVEKNYNLSYFSCLGSDPIGMITMNIGIMNINDSIYFSWNSTGCVPDVCNATVIAHRWRYSATYKDPCGYDYTMTEDWGSVGGIQYMTATPWLPTDLVGGIPEKLNFTINSNSYFPFTSKSRFTVKLTLPAGISHSLAANDIKFTDIYGVDWKPFYVKQSGNDVIAYYNVPNITINKSELNIFINADCKVSNASGIKSFSLSILYENDSSCLNNKFFQLYCYTGQIKVHCTKTCSNGGMLFKTFFVKRKTLGLPDNNNDGNADGSGSLDLKKIRLQQSMLYDTLSTFYSGMVMASGTTTLFFNGRIKSTIANGNLLSAISPANINIYRNGKLRYSCNKIPVNSYLSGSNRITEVDLNLNTAKTAGCGKISDYFFLAGDSVVVNVNYVYSTSVGYYSVDAVFDNTEYYVATTSNPSQSQKLQCDTFSGRHILLGNYFTNWYTENYSGSTCSPVTLYNSFYFSGGNCCDNYAGGNAFPYEYRNFTYLDNIKVAIPPGYTFSSAAIYYYRSAGSLNYTSHYASNLRAIQKGTDTLIFNLDTLFNPTKGIFKRSDEGYQGTLVLNLQAGCKSAINTYEPVAYYSNFKWANGKIATMNNYPDSIKFDHPSIVLSAINSLSVSKKDTFAWDIILSNTRSGSSIDNVWLANSQLDKASIFGIQDLATNSFLGSKNGIYKAGTLNSNNSRVFRVYARTKNCTTDSFKLAVGWNCTAYPDSLNGYGCKNLLNYVNLVLSPVPPLLVSTLYDDTARTDVCTQRKYRALLSNADEDNIYNLKLKVTIPPGMTFVDTGLYYMFPYGSKPAKLSKPVLVSGTTYEWSLSDSLSVLKNGLERVSDTLKSRFQVQFLLETNCQITAGAFVSILPDGKIGCGEPVRKIGYTGSPIRIKGVDNPYITLITLSPDSVNMCTPSVTLKSKMIILGPTKTLNNDSLILSLPAGFTPDTANFSSSRIPGKGKIRSINGEIQWSWLIPKNMPPGDSILMDLKLFVTNKPGSCGTEPFLMQSVTKKKAFCVKTNDSCDINVATGSFYKSFKADKAEPVIRLLRSVSVIAGDSGEIVDVAFSVSNNKKAIDTALKTNFYLVVDKNANNKFDKSDVVVQKFVKANGWPTKQTNTFAFKGFVKNTDICRLIIFSDSSNCQCLKNVLPLINIRLQNAGRDTSFCSNYSVILGRDSIKGYKYEWIPPDFLSNPKGAKPVFKKPNFTANNQTFTYYLKTTRLGGCTSTDTVIIITKPSIYLPKLKDTIGICFGSSINIGDTAKGGKGFLTFKWNPSTNLTPTNKMVVKANPKSTTKYVLTISDQNNCSIKDSSTLLVARAPSVKIGVVGNCEKKAIRFIDESNYNGLAKGTTMWRIDFNNVAQIDPPYIFDTIGFYFVRLIVSNSLGCTDSNYRFVTVNGNPAVYNTKANACIGDSVLLTDNSTVAKMKVKSVVWAFGTDTVKAKSAKKAFTKSGVTYFTQTVVSDSGCITQLVDSLVVLAPPKIGIGFTGKCVVDTINIKSSVKLSNNDSVQKYTWTVKNQTFNTANTRFKFDSAGTYTIALKAISKAGCKDSFSRKLVINPMPMVKFSIGNYCNYDTLKTVNSSSISKGKITKYQWLRDNGKTVTSNNYVFGPLKEGLYAVKLIAISDSSCSDSTEQLTTVHPAIKPAMVFNTPCVGDSVKFSDVSNLGNAKVGTRTWNFVSQSFTDSSFKILAATQGKFTVKYKVITDKGCTYSLDSTYTVVPKPVASFTSSSVCKDNTVIFSDLSLPGINSKIASRKWYHAGNFIKTDSSFIRVFANAGNEPMSLVVVNAFGCKDSTSQMITVEPKNYTNFSVNDACPGDSVTAKYLGFTGNNAVSSHKLTWGDGYTSSSFPHTHSYSSTGTYVLKLTTTTLPGCDYDTIHNVKIHPVPKADFDFFPLFPDVKYPNITLTDKSLGAVTWNYSVDDSLFSVLQNPKYSFPDSGSYFIKLKVSNSFGCVDSTQKMVYVNFILLTHIPNAFSPGNDDINPLFKPEGLGIKDYRMTIYNRWGEKIYDADWGKQPWDGTYKGEFVQIGSYPYYMEVIDFGNIRHSYQGLIQVIR